jgi:uncharacterized Fe-S cluster-containing radical SAM superfamily enzyme
MSVPCDIAVPNAGIGVFIRCAVGTSLAWMVKQIRTRYGFNDDGSLDCNGFGIDDSGVVESGNNYVFVGGSKKGRVGSLFCSVLSNPVNFRRFLSFSYHTGSLLEQVL